MKVKKYDVAIYINNVFTIVGDADIEFNVDGRGTNGIGGNFFMDLSKNQVFFLIEHKEVCNG